MDDFGKAKCTVYSSLFSVATTYLHNELTLLITHNDNLWPAFTRNCSLTTELWMLMLPSFPSETLLLLVLTFKDQWMTNGHVITVRRYPVFSDLFKTQLKTIIHLRRKKENNFIKTICYFSKAFILKENCYGRNVQHWIEKTLDSIVHNKSINKTVRTSKIFSHSLPSCVISELFLIFSEAL